MFQFVVVIIAFILTISVSGEWDQCELPGVSWIAYDDGPGASMGYALSSTGIDGILVGGTFKNRLTLRSPRGSLEVINQNEEADNTFLAQLNADGMPTMLKDFEGFGRDILIDLVYEPSSNKIAVCGYFYDNLTLGDTTLENSRSTIYDGFVALLDGTSGTVDWATSYSNVQDTKLFGVTFVDGKVVAAGRSCSAIDSCSAILLSFNQTNGNLDDSKLFENSEFYGIRYLNNFIYVVGTLNGNQTPSSSNTVTPIGEKDLIVASFDAATLAVSWYRHFGISEGKDSGFEIEIAGSNTIAVTSSTKTHGTRTISGFGGVLNTLSTVPMDQSGMLLSLDATTGSIDWSKPIPNSRGLRSSPDNNFLYIMGFKSGGFFDNGHSLGSYDIFLAKISTNNGNGIWAMDLGGGDDFEYPWSLGMDINGDVYISGLTSSTDITFGGVTVSNLPTDAYNMIVVKVSTSSEAIPSCKSSCSTIKDDFCFISNQCFKKGASPFVGMECISCDPSKSTTEWQAPNTDYHCFIENKCLKHGDFKSSSTCQYCNIPKSTSSWTLHSGYKNEECELDSTQPLPSCPTGFERDESKCSISSPCYDTTRNECKSPIQVCQTGKVYTTQCSNFPVEACYDLNEHDCYAPLDDNPAATEKNCPVGALYSTSVCPNTHPCYDHGKYVCVEQQIKTSSPTKSPTNPFGIEPEQKDSNDTLTTVFASIGAVFTVLCGILVYQLIKIRKENKNLRAVKGINP